MLGDVLVGQQDGALDDALPDALETAAYVGPFADPWDVAAPLPFVIEVHHDGAQDPLTVPPAVLTTLREWDVAQDLVVAATRRMTTELRQRLADPVTLPRLSVAAEVVHGGLDRLSAVPQQLSAVTPEHVRATALELTEQPHRLLTRGPHA